MAVSVWLDCDPGHDDALAIVLAAHSPAIALAGVSTVFGNQSLDKTTRNALRMLHAVGAAVRVPVHAGAAKPLLRPPVACPEIHGDSGLNIHPSGATLPDSTHEARAHAPAILCMAEAVRSGSVLVCTGALTNAALMLSVFPELAAPSTRIVFMGGSLGEGNTGAVAEFNMQVDPHAAHIVLNSGADVTMVPLQVTHTALVTEDVLSRVRGGTPDAPRTRFRDTVANLLMFFAATYANVFGFHSGPPLHDPVAVAYVLAPELFVTEMARIDVECESPLSYGQTVWDRWKQSGRAANVRVTRSMDVSSFWHLMVSAIASADAVSPLNVDLATASYTEGVTATVTRIV